MRRPNLGSLGAGVCGAMMGLMGWGLLAGAPAAAAPQSPAKCLSSDGFLVIHRDSTLGPGSDILVRPVPAGAAAPECIYKKTPGDVEVSSPNEADYVVGAAGRFLVMDRGTGPSRNLVIYDMAARKPVLTQAYDGETPVKITAEAVTFSAIVGPATAKTCPKFQEYTKQGLTPVLTSETSVRLPSLARTKSAATRCAAQQ